MIGIRRTVCKNELHIGVWIGKEVAVEVSEEDSMRCSRKPEFDALEGQRKPLAPSIRVVDKQYFGHQHMVVEAS